VPRLMKSPEINSVGCQRAETMALNPYFSFHISVKQLVGPISKRSHQITSLLGVGGSHGFKLWSRNYQQRPSLLGDCRRNRVAKVSNLQAAWVIFWYS